MQYQIYILLIFYYKIISMDNEKQKAQALKIRKDKKKNTQTGLLMGQNTNIFSQLSATYLQSKSSATQQQTNFVNSTQIVEYHDPNINRLIALLRKKADVTKAKAAVELKQQIMKMNEDNIQEFASTFSHLFMEIVINQQSKAVIDQFITMLNFIITNFKKIIIKEIATIFGPLLVIQRANNTSQNKVYATLFSGSDQQIQQKAITLLLSKNVTKKFLIFCRVIIQCQQTHKIGQQNFQRNCSFLLKVLKQFTRNYESLAQKKEQISSNFVRFITQINDIVTGKFVQQYFKIGGKAKSSFLQFYQTLISLAAKHPQWNIDWQNLAKIICQNYLDKDIVVQQSLWRYCNKQFIQSSLQLQKKINKQKQQKFWILHRFLPKPDEKLLSAIKIGGQSLYKQLPAYCTVFPYTTIQDNQTHKSLINKINFIRKLMQTVLQQQDQNQSRTQCYYQLCIYFIKTLRNCQNKIQQLQQKKQQQIRSLLIKAQKQLINNLQQKQYKNPGASRNSFGYYLPSIFCKLIDEVEPQYDFSFDKKQTFPLYCNLKNKNNQSEYCNALYNKIYENCKNDYKLILAYLENFPSKSINIEMSAANNNLQQSSKIFILSKQSQIQQNWFAQHWDTSKKILTFDPRICPADLQKIPQSKLMPQLKPSNRYDNALITTYIRPKDDNIRLKFFLQCLNSDSQEDLHLCGIMVSLIKEVIMERSAEAALVVLNQLLGVFVAGIGPSGWAVSGHQVGKFRILAQLIIHGLYVVNRDEKNNCQQKVSKQQLDKFLQNYCSTTLKFHNYKLQSQTQQLLKLLQKITSIPYVQQKVVSSVKESIKQSYKNFIKFSPKQKENQNVSVIASENDEKEKQRKNRLLRMLGFVKKVLWYGLNRRSNSYHIDIFFDMLKIEGWAQAQYRPDLWLMIQCILQIIDQETRQILISQLIQQPKTFSLFITLLMCYQLLLSLQRYPSTKKCVFELQSQFLKRLKQQEGDKHKKKLKILNCMICEAVESQSYMLIFGIKNILRSFMRNSQSIDQEILGEYARLAIQMPLTHLKSTENNETFNRLSFLLINTFSQLPLLDLPNIQKKYDQFEGLLNSSLSQQANSQNSRFLSYLAIVATMWQASVGVQKVSSQLSQKILKRLLIELKQLSNNQTQALKQASSNFPRFYMLTFLTSYIQLKGKQSIKDLEQFIHKQLIFQPARQGSLLHGALQSIRYKFISKIFNFCSKEVQNKLIVVLPEEILKEVRFYKDILDQIQNQGKLEEGDVEQVGSQAHHHYQNIVNMFIQSAEVLVRITSCISKELKPNEQTILQLLHCPFAGIKKTSFMLLKQMYQLKLVQKVPPPIFLTYLKCDLELTKKTLDPISANQLSGYLYSWQAIIQRRSAIQRVAASEEEINITLEDYLQTNQIHESFLRTVFEVLENQLQYTKNQQQYEILPEELMQMDTIVTIQDDLNLSTKIFRLTIRTLFIFIQNFPLFLRDFIDKNKKYKTICERLLRNVISDSIFKQQVSKIQIRQHQWKSEGNFEIYVIPKNKEIYAEYQHDVIRIGLRLMMKSNYPLTPIAIEFGDGLKIQQGSKWALMLQTQLHSRNNTIINGILLWKQNIDKKLAGVQQCAICFDIVNSAGQLPKKGCKTCKKKFHSVCIMRWFSKSNKSQCPLCKSQFL